MAAYTIERFVNEPILIVSYQHGWTLARDGDPMHEAVWQALETSPVPVFYIVDVTIEPRFNLDDLMVVTRNLLNNRKPILRHFNMREHILITKNLIILRASRTLPWGLVAHAVETREAALAYIRERVERGG